MFVYLLHFEKRISGRHTCQHYLGYADNLAARIQQHERGGRQAARLTQVAHERGIPFTVARVWRGGRDFERRLKAQKNTPRLCPVCAGQVQQPGLFELTPAQIAEELIPF
jgi:hypothetical protein